MKQRDAVLENRRMDSKGEGGWENWEAGIDMCTLLRPSLEVGN